MQQLAVNNTSNSLMSRRNEQRKRRRYLLGVSVSVSVSVEHRRGRAGRLSHQHAGRTATSQPNAGFQALGEVVAGCCHVRPTG